MMSGETVQIPLSERLDELRPLRTPVPASFEQIQRTIRRVMDRYDAPERLPEHEAERLFDQLRRRIQENDWNRVPMSLVTKVAALVFSSVHRLRDDLADLRVFLLREIEASDRPGFLNPMVRIYIESFEAGAEHTETLANALRSAQRHIGARWRILLENVPELLDPSRAAAAIGALMAGMDQPWHGLRAKGLRQPHAPGLMDEAHLEFLGRIAPDLQDRTQIERLLGWLKPDEKTVRLVGAGPAIERLIAVWVNRAPPKEIQSLLIDRITELYGHPRVNRNAAWNQVSPQLERLFLRWLMGADIRFLFRVLTEVERGHMWADREAFWWTLHEQGRIDEVWIAFSDEGHRAAMAKLPMDARQSGRRFARQVGDRDKSLLIMRIGGQIVVEGTSNFKVHAFDATDPRAPKLYLPKYDTGQIRDLPGALWKKSHLGNWQDDVHWRL